MVDDGDEGSKGGGSPSVRQSTTYKKRDDELEVSFDPCLYCFVSFHASQLINLTSSYT